jgi:hypothetical protein
LLSDWGISAAGILDADALPTNEKPSPAAAPSTLAAVPVERFFFEDCLSGLMAAPLVLVNALGVPILRSARGARKINLSGIKPRDCSNDVRADVDGLELL